MKLSKTLQIFGLFLILTSLALTRKLKTKKSNTKAALCPKIKSTPNDVDITSADVFPVDSQGEDAKKSAEIQTKAARELFYKPTGKVKAVLQNVAKGYAKIVTQKEIGSPFFHINKIQRQTGEAGTWQVYQLFKTDLNIDEDKFHQDVVTRISIGTDVLARDYLGFLGLLGDIGACLQDVVNRPSSVNANLDGDKPKFNIKGSLLSYFGDSLVQKSKDFYAKYSPDSYYDVKTGTTRSKKGDRQTCSASGRRSGVMDVGKAVDDTIDVGGQKAGKLKAEAQLPSVSWPWQTVKKTLVDFCPKEAWAGHFSGSLYELILMLELFDRASPTTATEPSDDKKKTYAAIASAFLLATGMHSAVEVVYVDKLYTGAASLTADKILSNDVCSGATNWVKALITAQNS